MGLFRPKSNRLGTDFAGQVEAVGKDVTQFRPGDEVFGGRSGAFAEYVCVREDRAVVPKPANATFEQAAAVPVAALTALQGLRDKGRFSQGKRCSSTVRREASARSPYRSPKRPDPR